MIDVSSDWVSVVPALKMYSSHQIPARKTVQQTHARSLAVYFQLGCRRCLTWFTLASASPRRQRGCRLGLWNGLQVTAQTGGLITDSIAATIGLTGCPAVRKGGFTIISVDIFCSGELAGHFPVTGCTTSRR
jgi:hypothetical protein